MASSFSEIRQFARLLAEGDRISMAATIRYRTPHRNVFLESQINYQIWQEGIFLSEQVRHLIAFH